MRENSNSPHPMVNIYIFCGLDFFKLLSYARSDIKICAQLENESRVYHKNITPAIILSKSSTRGCFKSVSINCPLAPFRAKNHQVKLSKQ